MGADHQPGFRYKHRLLSDGEPATVHGFHPKGSKELENLVLAEHGPPGRAAAPKPDR